MIEVETPEGVTRRWLKGVAKAETPGRMAGVGIPEGVELME